MEARGLRREEEVEVAGSAGEVNLGKQHSVPGLGPRRDPETIRGIVLLPPLAMLALCVQPH